MTKVLIDTDEIRKIVREEMRDTVRETLDEEFRFRMMALMLAQVPEISEEEQKEIERLYGKPSRKVARVLTLEHK